jgi:Zn finger protein HypA/HybF involved in hydrogenase expression
MTFEKTKGGIPIGTLNVIASGTGGKSILTQSLYDQQMSVECWCHRCCKEQTGYQHMFQMVLCPICGNKRCPKSSDHRLECSGSNEPNQKGSIYGGI